MAFLWTCRVHLRQQSPGVSVSCNANNRSGGKRPGTHHDCGNCHRQQQQQQLQQRFHVRALLAETAGRIMGIDEGQRPAMARLPEAGPRHRGHRAAARQYAADRRW